MSGVENPQLCCCASSVPHLRRLGGGGGVDGAHHYQLCMHPPLRASNTGALLLTALQQYNRGSDERTARQWYSGDKIRETDTSLCLGSTDTCMIADLLSMFFYRH